MTVPHARVNCKQNSNFNYTYTVPEGRVAVILFRSPSEVLLNDFYVPVEENTVIVYHGGSTMSYKARGDKEFLHDFGHFQYSQGDFNCGYNEKEYLAEIPDSKPIKLMYPNELSHILKMIVDEAAASQLLVNENIAHLIFILFNLLKREYDLQSDIANQGIHYFALYELRNKIYSAPEQAWTVEQMCKIVHLSVPYFELLYKQYFGVPPMNDVIKARIDVAKKKLIYSNINISLIAEESGYKNVEHFTRQFKEIAGVSPSKYRNSKNT